MAPIVYPHRHVLFVCHANVARSVMAEYILRRMLAERGIDDRAIRVTSGGIAPYARDGSLVSLDTRLVLRDIGIDLAPESVARDLKRGHRHLLQESDLILTMTAEQVGMVRSHLDGREVALATLRDFAGLGGPHPGHPEGDVADPAGQDEEVFAWARDRIQHALEHAIPRLLG